MKHDSTVFVGLDVHKESIVAAYAVDFGEVEDLGEVGVREYDWERLCRRMQSKASQVVFVYEAGPCGYALQRFLTRKGHACRVCAPSLVPKKPGDRVKTDRRDARSAAGTAQAIVLLRYRLLLQRYNHLKNLVQRIGER